MEATIKLLDPWWRDLRGVLEAVVASEEHATWELRVLLPRQSKYTPQQWGRRTRTTSSEGEKLQRIREGLELLSIIRAIDETVWTRILVHRCAVGGFDNPQWTDDARVLPVLHLQPYHADSIADIVDALEQCRQLVVTLQDETKLSADFGKTKRELTVIAKAMKRAIPQVAYRVKLSNWMSPNTLLSAAESRQMWEKLSEIIREPPAAASAPPLWQLVSLDLHLLRSVVTFDGAIALLELGNKNVRVDELWIDLLDRSDDELTASGLAAVLTKLFTGPSPPRHLRVDCENANQDRLRQLTQVLQATTAPIALSLDRFGLTSARSVQDRVALFTALGVCLRQRCIQSLKLDIPEFSGADITTMAAAFTNAERSMGLSSLVLTTDCRRESWGVVEKMLHLVGRNLDSLEIEINGETLSEKAPKAILSLCPRLQHVKLHRLKLGKHNPLVLHLQEPSSRLRSLSLPRLQAPLPVIGELSRAIADTVRPCTLQSLHLDLSEIPTVCDEIVSGLSAALQENKNLRAMSLTLDGDAAAALSDPVHDDFYHLHNERLVLPLARRCKLAFLSVAACPKLSPLPLALIFQFAGAQSRRRVSIRETGVPW